MVRAYWKFNNQWKHVYILDHMKQIDIFGKEHIMAIIKLTQYSKETYDVDVEDLRQEKPRTRKKERIS